MRGNYAKQAQQLNQHQNIHDQASQGHNNAKGRASSSYGSLQSRTTNAIISQGKGAGTQNQTNLLNKSGISATSGVMIGGQYSSNARHYQDASQASNTNTFSSLNNLNSTVIRPITRDIKLRSQAANRHPGSMNT